MNSCGGSLGSDSIVLSEGYLPAVFTVMGIILSAWGYKHVHHQLFRRDTGSCE